MTNDKLKMTNGGINYINNIAQRYLHLTLDIRHLSLVLLLLLSGLLFFFKLGSFSLYDAAETTYGEFIKQIRLSGDWITMHYNGKIIFDKPPLYFWLATLATFIFGFNEFAIRFWAAVAGVATVLITFLFGSKLYNQKTGFYAALIAMTAFQFLIQSRIAELDILLVFLLTSALFCFYLGYQTKKAAYYWLMYLAMALATLVKGIIGIALPAAGIFFFLIFSNVVQVFRPAENASRPKGLHYIVNLLKETQLLPGILIILLIGAPWYIAEWLLHGQEFVRFALGFLFLARFQGVVSGHPGPCYYYFLAILLGFAPWSHFIPYALKRTWQNKKNDPELLMLCYLIPIFVVFSIAKTKLPNYVLPLYPFLAITVGKLWYDFLETNQEQMKKGLSLANIFLAVIVFLIIIGFALLGSANYSGPYQQEIPKLLFLAGILIVGSLVSIVSFFIKQYKLSFYALPVMVFIITLVLTLQTLPTVEKYKGTKELAAKVSGIIKADEEIAAYNIGNRPGVVFYNSKPVDFLKNEREVTAFLKNKQGYCFTTVAEYEKIKGQVKLFARQGELVVIY